MYNKRMSDKDLLKQMNQYIEELKELRKTNPELAKKIAMESMQRQGIIDENGKLKPPYNGQKVNEDDFTRGPNESHDEEER